MSYRERGRKVVRKTRKKTATKLYKSAYTNASVTSFGTCSSTRNWSSKKQPISTIVQAFTCPESKVRISSGFTSGNNRLSGQKKRIIAVSSEPVSTQFLQPITIRIGDYSYLYIQYGISISLHHTISVLMTLIFFWPESIFMTCFTSESSLSDVNYSSFVLPLKMICGTSITLFADYHLDCGWITFFGSPPRYSVVTVFVYLPSETSEGECATNSCSFNSGMVTSPFTSQSSVTRTSRQGPLRSPPCLADVLQGDVWPAA